MSSFSSFLDTKHENMTSSIKTFGDVIKTTDGQKGVAMRLQAVHLPLTAASARKAVCIQSPVCHLYSYNSPHDIFEPFDCKSSQSEGAQHTRQIAAVRHPRRHTDKSMVVKCQVDRHAVECMAVEYKYMYICIITHIYIHIYICVYVHVYTYSTAIDSTACLSTGSFRVWI